MILKGGALLTAGILLVYLTTARAHHIEVNITVPEFKVDQEDAYICVSEVLPPRPHKLIGVIPHARQEVVHHILLYGCSEPHMVPKDGKATAWRCDMQPVCNGPSVIFYGWGRNAPDLLLPDGVGYSVGELTGIRYIVAQVHYLAVRPPDDHSGVTLVLKPHAVPYAAGMLTYASWFEIPPGKKSHLIENSCCFKAHQPLTMFAVRVHTHALGRRVYMTREAWNHSGIETLHSRDPQLPQSFVPSTRHVLWPGDRLTVTCDFDSSNRSAVTVAGGTHKDEMCNMYVMVYGKTPYLTMCGNSEADIRDDSPGALPRGATLALDPSPFWKPPQPDGRVHDRRAAEGVQEEEEEVVAAPPAADPESSTAATTPSSPPPPEGAAVKDVAAAASTSGAATADAGTTAADAATGGTSTGLEAEVDASLPPPESESDWNTEDVQEDGGTRIGEEPDTAEMAEARAADVAAAPPQQGEQQQVAAKADTQAQAKAKAKAEVQLEAATEAEEEAEEEAEALALAAEELDYEEQERKAEAAEKKREVEVDPRGSFGDATSVTAGPDGSIWVLYRASGVWQSDTFDGRNVITRKQPVPEPVVVRMDPDNGTVLARWGGGVFYLPHMISSDAAGNVWVVDVGRHQVLKFSSEGQLLLSVGTELTPGSGHSHFCKPTQVAVLRDGSFLVADGYCNNRVVMFDEAGKFVAESVGVPAVVHSVLVDECEGLAYVASREAGKVLALHLDPKKRLQLAATYDMKPQGHGEAWALGFGPYGEQLALMWREGQDARLVHVRFPQQFWVLPGTSRLSPHDFQLGGAPMQLSGAGDRFYAVYLASVGVACDKQCGPLRKFVVVPGGVRLPERWELPSSSDVTELHPGDAKLLPGGTAVEEQTHHREDQKEAAEGKGPLAAGVASEAEGEGPAVEGPAKEGAEGGAMLADDYDEEVEGDAIDAGDYEERVREKEKEEEAEEDYERIFMGKDGPGPRSPAPLEKERFEVLVRDKQVVRQSTSISGWGVALLVVLAVLMAFSVLKFSKTSLSAYLQEGPFRRLAGAEAGAGGAGGGGGIDLPGTVARGRSAAGGSAAGGSGGKQEGVWAVAEGLLSRMRRSGGGAAPASGRAGGGGRGGSAARDVEAARERERLLRAGPSC